MIIKRFDKAYSVVIGTPCIIAKCGSGHSYFGENAYVVDFLDKHIKFKTESGKIFKTDYYLNTVGKANEYFVMLGDRMEKAREDKNFHGNWSVYF